MGTGVHQALKLIREYNITATPTVWRLYRIAYGEGLILRYFPFRGRIEGSYLRTPDGIAILTLQSGLPPGYLKHVLAHGLGFHLIHRGPGTYIHGVVETDLDGHIRDFAATLLVPPGALKNLGGQIPPHEIARLAGIPYSLACWRVDLAGRYRV